MGEILLMKDRRVANCEASNIHGRFTVGEGDISKKLGNGKVDNDFHCPVTGEWVALVENGGKVWCTYFGCPHQDPSVEEPDEVAKLSSY